MPYQLRRLNRSGFYTGENREKCNIRRRPTSILGTQVRLADMGLAHQKGVRSNRLDGRNKMAGPKRRVVEIVRAGGFLQDAISTGRRFLSGLASVLAGPGFSCALKPLLSQA
jgi:hypothetical protein